MWLTNEQGKKIYVNPAFIVMMQEHNGGTYITMVHGSCFVAETMCEIQKKMYVSNRKSNSQVNNLDEVITAAERPFHFM